MSDDNNLIGQDEIERLLNGGGSGGGSDDAKAEEGDKVVESAAPPTSPGVDDSDDDKMLDQQDIESLLSQSVAGGSKAAPTPPGALPSVGTSSAAPLAGDNNIPQGDIEHLLEQAEAAIASIDNPNDDLPEGVREFQFEPYTGTPATTDRASLDLMRDVELDVKIELGRTHMYLEDILKLRRGWVVPLDKLAGDPVDIFVNGRLVARGEVLVMNDNFCVRIAELITGSSILQPRDTS